PRVLEGPCRCDPRGPGAWRTATRSNGRRQVATSRSRCKTGGRSCMIVQRAGGRGTGRGGLRRAAERAHGVQSGPAEAKPEMKTHEKVLQRRSRQVRFAGTLVLSLFAAEGCQPDQPRPEDPEGACASHQQGDTTWVVGPVFCAE